ncbi:hypothetical protein ACU5P1_00920 [Pseudomonas plecoglossicida]|uniref:Uncharacterized protein n=1 Tax=Pseudomonas plecoglossicida TaxID=70775 RepID=A0AAD0R369_PSEDL|nr:hypothetical protein [Pseudomonas plecoglossicida]AXM97156.1 hypothetical protein DVB73_15855 [Pseudomonas plecoglossicida]EPB96582.1 hypothetical protein L321_07357 [Pseudomonas plecoglossicida NB2011]QLB53473.1 hypothetical protein HAV28_00920 [Pseudomonas plecoglossicida]GLR36547.1 hypothetical protein GCM10011247_19440 [Pseudomonas plecoglossicida]
MNTLARPQPRHDAWAANASHSTVRYCLQAEAEPDTLCRVLNLFALQFLTPHRVNVSQQDDLLDIEIGIGGLSWHRAEVIAQKLRNLVCVMDVSLENQMRLEMAVV